MDINNRLKNIFIDLFNLNNAIPVSEIKIDQVEDWDSLNHLNLIIAIENEFVIDIQVNDFPRLYNDFETILKYIDGKMK